MSVSVAIITRGESDLSRLLQRCDGVSTVVFAPHALGPHSLDTFDCACVFGGTHEEPLVLPARSRSALEAFSAAGKRVFYEYALSFAQNYCMPPESTRFLRLVCADGAFTGMPEGTLLDEQCNFRSAPYYKCRGARPVLVYKKGLTQHACEPLSESDKEDHTAYGVWFETPTTAVCSFRLCNFVRARFAPVSVWRRVVAALVEWLCGTPVELPPAEPAYTLGRSSELGACAQAALHWFEASGTLLDGGNGGVLEGLGTEIFPDGHQKIAFPIRTDCCGEAAMAYFFHALATGDAESRARSGRLEAYVYDVMQVKTGRCAGMLRWTDVAWEVCYQDDMARAMLVTLLKALYGQGREYLPQCRMALEFLMNTTGPDGLRPARTDNLNMTQSDFERLHMQNGAFPCAHYNAFYLACLLLYGKMERDARCLEVGERGMRSLLAAYPKTVREQSETEELCRLLLPVSWLYYATGKEADLEMLYTVIRSLEAVRHPSGAYLEWDSDYSAACSRQEGGECSLLSRNGDPVADLLYSNNWVPMGLMQAYFVTGDENIYALFLRHAGFLASAQISSRNAKINGAWARGYDVDMMEVFGLPNDVGWGPWAVESGWTVAEITAGLYSGLLKDKLKEFYR